MSPYAALGMLAATMVSACMPYAIPPANAAVGAVRDGGPGARAGVRAEVGLSPLQLVDGQLERVWDATLSGSFARTNRDTWGLALAMGPILHPWRDRTAGRRTDRVLPQLIGRWTTRGHGVGVRVTIERATFVRGTYTGSDSIGRGHGEAAIGFYIEPGYVHADRMGGWSVSAGLTLRLPAMVGVVACCIR